MTDHDDELVFADEDELVFAEEPESLGARTDGKTWKLMIVDDEDEVHNVTRIVFGDYSFEGAGFEFLSAYSGSEARDLLADHPDAAVILLDVVMETDQAGLDLVRYIRQDLKNDLVRIILRTGQPGQAPEKEVIVNYDINDYKAKNELTSQKLFTSVTAALRSYRDLKIIEKSRRGLEKIVDSSAGLLKLPSLKQFTSGVLTQLTSILGLDESSVLLQASIFAANQDGDDHRVLAGTGRFEKFVDKELEQIEDPDLVELAQKSLSQKTSLHEGGRFVGYFVTENGFENILYLKSLEPLSETDQGLIEIFLSNVAIAFDNIYHKVNLEQLVEQRTLELKKEKDKVEAAHRVLAKYVPPQLTDRILTGAIDDVWEHSRKRLTMFFSDIKDFTRLSEALEPEDIAGLLNDYFSEMYEIAQKHGGVVANIIGDGLFIFFGAPEVVNDREHALRCVRMAVEMQRRMVELQSEWFDQGLQEPMQIRCGINTGMVNVGGFGSKERRDFTALGIQVNLASRLEGLCRPGEIMISHAAWALVKEEFECEAKGMVEVKGISHPIRVYEVVFEKPPSSIQW